MAKVFTVETFRSLGISGSSANYITVVSSANANSFYRISLYLEPVSPVSSGDSLIASLSWTNGGIQMSNSTIFSLTTGTNDVPETYGSVSSDPILLKADASTAIILEFSGNGASYNAYAVLETL